MYRRRRTVREIEFSFDSFLDLVANVVGILLRLILVAWVGARSYKAIAPVSSGPLPVLSEPAPLPEPTDPRLARVQQRRHQINRESAVAVRQHEENRQQALRRQESLQRDLAALAALQSKLRAEQSDLDKQATHGMAVVKSEALSLVELEDRSRKLLRELDEFKKLPRTTTKLRYNTPVSAPLQTEELMFECQHGRVTLLDRGALEAEIEREARNKRDTLQTQWQVRDATIPIGAFRLRYVVERVRSMLDGPGTGGPLGGQFSSTVTSWEAEPVSEQRGETLERALEPGSDFRRLLDALDPQQTAVTFWVYPDSFAMYRKLRDYLHGREIVVAGRPLPPGVPIGCSRSGTKSRGQ